MTERPERLDIQVRRARSRRHARLFGSVVGLGGAGMFIYEGWAVSGWHWWYIPAASAAIVVALWLARLDADAIEEMTRWFWRPPT